MPRVAPLVSTLRAVAGTVLRGYDGEVARLAARVGRGRGYPTNAEVREVVRAMASEAIAYTRSMIRATGEPVPAFADLVRQHEVGALPDAMRLVRAAEKAGLSPQRTRRDLARLLRGDAITYSDYGLAPSSMARLRTVQSDGRRVFVTEANEAIRRAGLRSLRASGARRAHWVLSPMHKKRDRCDDLAEGGPYPISQFPRAPHPHCGCMPGPVED